MFFVVDVFFFCFIGKPSRVIHIRNIPNDSSESEVIQLGLPFGRVTNVLVLKGKNQAFLEMADEVCAAAMVACFNTNPPQVRGRTVYVQFSNHRELKIDQSHSVIVSINHFSIFSTVFIHICPLTTQSHRHKREKKHRNNLANVQNHFPLSQATLFCLLLFWFLLFVVVVLLSLLQLHWLRVFFFNFNFCLIAFLSFSTLFWCRQMRPLSSFVLCYPSQLYAIIQASLFDFSIFHCVCDYVQFFFYSLLQKQRFNRVDWHFLLFCTASMHHKVQTEMW